MITDREGLWIGTLIFYLPALFIASYLAFKHGFGRQAGWLLLILLSLARIVGSICEIVSVSSPSKGVITAFVVLSSVGLSSLILAMLALLKRVHEGMAHRPSLPPRIFNFLASAPMAGLVLAIIGGSDLSSSNDPSKVAHAQTLLRAAIIIFFVVFVVLVAVTIFTFFSFRSISPGERRILYAVTFSIPFLFVRILYSLLTNFNTGTTFSLSTGNVVIQACMATIEEFIVVVLYLTAGILAPKITRTDVQPARRLAAVHEQYSPAAAQEAFAMQQSQRNSHTESLPTFVPSESHDNGYIYGGRRIGRRRQGPIAMLISRFR